MVIGPSVRAGPGQSTGSMRDRQRPRVEAADGSAQTTGDRGVFVCNKHLSLEPNNRVCVRVCLCGCDRVGFNEKTILKSRDPMQPRTTYELGVHGQGGQNE
jgi:hypothetical protein